MLRFGFMDEILGREASASFLNSLIVELAAYVPSPRVYLDAMGEDVSLSGKLALERPRTSSMKPKRNMTSLKLLTTSSRVRPRPAQRLSED
jgi:hypothetical protein